MRNNRVIRVVLALIVLAVLALPANAYALPKRWEGSPQFTRDGVTYRVNGGDAVVTRTKGKKVTIPARIRYKDKTYRVRAIWEDALKGARVITIRATLETCESPRLWSKNTKVRVTSRTMYKWLHRTGANVRLV